MRWAACAKTSPRCGTTRSQRKGFDHLVDPAAAPMADILALIARERLTGDPPPPAAQALVDAFRAQIEAKAGPDLDRLTGTIEDQKAFARIARAIVRDMELGDDLSDAPDQDTEEEESQDGEAEASNEGEGEGEDQSPQSATLDDSEKSHRESETAESTLTEAEEDENAEPSDEELETGDGDRPARPDLKDRGKPEPAYKVYTTAPRRGGQRRGALRRRGTDAAARLPGPAAGPPVQCRRAPRQPPAAPPAGAAEPHLDLRPRGGHARRGAADPGDRRPDRAAVVQAGGGHRVPRHGGLAADRQLRLDARAADHGRRGLRRHPGAHAGALRRQGRDPRLHHPGLEGRRLRATTG